MVRLHVVMLFFAATLHGWCGDKTDKLEKKSAIPAILQDKNFRKHFEQLQKENSTWSKVKKRFSPKNIKSTT